MAAACLDTDIYGLVISKFWPTVRAWPAFGVARVRLNVSPIDNVQPRSSNQNDVLPCHKATFTYVTEIINALVEIGWCKRIAAREKIVWKGTAAARCCSNQVRMRETHCPFCNRDFSL